MRSDRISASGSQHARNKQLRRSVGNVYHGLGGGLHLELWNVKRHNRDNRDNRGNRNFGLPCNLRRDTGV